MAASEFNFPHRAPTQFWMISTFALFVGAAVIIVGLYGLLVMRNRLQNEARSSLQREAEFFSIVAARIQSERDLELSTRLLSHTTGLRVTVWREDSLVWDVHEGHAMIDGTGSGMASDVQRARERGTSVSLRASGDGVETLYVTVAPPEYNVAVRLGEENPPLFVVMGRMQATLIFGMVLALILAILGSWVASKRVTKPLRSLTRSAQRIAGGELNEEISVASRTSEFQDLSESLNEMAGQFRDDITKLEKLIALQTEFVGNVSHEVRNPIFAVGGYLEALGGEALTPEQRRRYAGKGTANLERLSNLFSDLIEIARLEYREDLIHREPFRFDEVAEEVVEIARQSAENKGLTISVDTAPLMVLGDRQRIRQVLANLVENAVAYTDKGNVQIAVTADDNTVQVAVTDTGHGIASEHLERIFDRFYRVDRARSRRYGGTGLGLSIVKQILHAHGETIDVCSTPGEGSTFSFSLPLADAAGVG
jgi:signal transduction histidine kinase